MTPKGEWFVKTKGIPSGSYLTVLIGSICNAIANIYILQFKMRIPIKFKVF